MGLQPVQSATSGGIPVFAAIDEVMTGGFSLVTTGLTSGELIPSGAPIAVNEGTRLGTFCKTAEVYENTAGGHTEIHAKKGSHFIVGSVVAKTVGNKAYALTAVDKTTSSAYDILTIGTTLGALTAGDVLFESSAEGATAAAIQNSPNGLLLAPVKVGAMESGDVVIKGTAYSRRIRPLTTTQKSGLKGIIFTDSK
jgi:hypothetical protein